ncbi:flagellar protein FlaG [Aeromonas media]
MANELTAMSPATASTVILHGGQQAAMSVSSSPQSVVVGEGNPVEQTGKVVKALTPDVKGTGATADREKDKDKIEKQAQELHAKKLQERLASLSELKGWTVQFSLEPELDQPLIRVVDVDTRQVIRQIPSEEMLLISKRLQSLEQNQADSLSLSGLLFDDRV